MICPSSVPLNVQTLKEDDKSQVPGVSKINQNLLKIHIFIFSFLWLSLGFPFKQPTALCSPLRSWTMSCDRRIPDAWHSSWSWKVSLRSRVMPAISKRGCPLSCCEKQVWRLGNEVKGNLQMSPKKTPSQEFFKERIWKSENLDPNSNAGTIYLAFSWTTLWPLNCAL